MNAKEFKKGAVISSGVGAIGTGIGVYALTGNLTASAAFIIAQFAAVTAITIPIAQILIANESRPPLRLQNLATPSDHPAPTE